MPGFSKVPIDGQSAACSAVALTAGHARCGRWGAVRRDAQEQSARARHEHIWSLFRFFLLPQLLDCFAFDGAPYKGLAFLAFVRSYHAICTGLIIIASAAQKRHYKSGTAAESPLRDDQRNANTERLGRRNANTHGHGHAHARTQAHTHTQARTHARTHTQTSKQRNQPTSKQQKLPIKHRQSNKYIHKLNEHTPGSMYAWTYVYHTHIYTYVHRRLTWWCHCSARSTWRPSWLIWIQCLHRFRNEMRDTQRDAERERITTR